MGNWHQLRHERQTNRYSHRHIEIPRSEPQRFPLPRVSFQFPQAYPPSNSSGDRRDLDGEVPIFILKIFNGESLMRLHIFNELKIAGSKLGRDLFFLGELGAALRAGEHFVGVGALVRVEGPAQLLHGV